MTRLSSGLAALLAVATLLTAGAGHAAAQTVYVTPTPVATYYAPAPVVSYYAPTPVATYYAPAPVATYYAPAPVVTTYRYGYGILPRNRVTVATYGPIAVAPAPVVGYYGPRGYFYR